MRDVVDRARLVQFMERLGASATSPGVVYLCGGSSALLLGIRDQTIDIDIKLDPEPAGAFRAISLLKDELGVNVELAAPDQFLPPLPGWREHSLPIRSVGPVEFRHYDLRAQALAKVARGLDQDVADARAFVDRGHVSADELMEGLEAVLPALERYPAVSASVLTARVRAFVVSLGDGDRG